MMWYVDVYGVDSVGTQGYTSINETLGFPQCPTFDEILAALEETYGPIYVCDYEEPYHA